MNDPKPVTREMLSQFLKSPRAIRAFEQLFDMVPADFTAIRADISVLRIDVDATTLESGQAAASANLALDLIELLVSAVEIVSLAPRREEFIPDDDTSPRLQVGTLADQDADRVAIIGGTITAALTNNTAKLMDSSAALTNGAAAALGTLANAPVAGNPTKWVPVNDNGTTRYVPMW